MISLLVGDKSSQPLLSQQEELPVTRTFCQQMDKTSHHQTVKQTTTDALVQLYNHVIDLPDGPFKQKFLQRVYNYVHKLDLTKCFFQFVHR